MLQNKKAQKEYSKMVEKASPNSPIFTNCLKAFFSGGLICGIGQLLLDYLGKTYTADESALLVSAILIVASAILTGFGVYEKIGKVCGAGTIVPITGFANSVVSPAIEFKKEGYVLGMAAKMFVLAGPVIVYGTLSSLIVGLVYYFVG